MKTTVFIAFNGHVDDPLDSPLGTEDVKGFRSYFEGACGDQWIAVAEEGRFRISGGDIGWEVREVLNPYYPAVNELFVKLNLELEIPERSWLLAVLFAAASAYNINTAVVTNA